MQVFLLFYLLTFSVGAAVIVFMGADLITGVTVRGTMDLGLRPQA